MLLQQIAECQYRTAGGDPEGKDHGRRIAATAEDELKAAHTGGKPTQEIAKLGKLSFKGR